MSGLVVIGASYAGMKVALTARQAGYAELVTVVSDEHSLPYERPPLSKGFLLGATRKQDLVLRDETFFASQRINLVLGHRATGIDRRARRVTLAGGVALDFEKVVIATGSRARRLTTAGAQLEGVCYLRSIADAIELKERLAHAFEIVIIGGGFIGLEVASSAVQAGKKVTVIESASRLLERAVSPLVSEFLLDGHLRAGVDVMLGETVVSMNGADGRVASVELANGIKLGAELVVVGIGGVANDELAKAAGVRCTNGIVVDEYGQADTHAIYAAGDCANHYNRFGNCWIRLESVQNAQDQAKAAGLAVAESHEAYVSVPRFWSDQYDIKLQMVGLSSRHDRMVVRGSVDEGKFSAFYYRADRLIAVDSINRPGDQIICRRYIEAGISPSPEDAASLSFDLKTVLKPN